MYIMLSPSGGSMRSFSLGVHDASSWYTKSMDMECKNTLLASRFATFLFLLHLSLLLHCLYQLHQLAGYRVDGIQWSEELCKVDNGPHLSESLGKQYHLGSLTRLDPGSSGLFGCHDSGA
jgi:hypothetical protein